MIYINNTLRITKIDQNCLQLEQYKECKDNKTKEVKHKWKWCGYYGDVKSALLGALDKSLFDCASNENTIKEVLFKIDTVRQEIITAIEQLNT
jgi:hypothetical protein